MWSWPRPAIRRRPSELPPVGYPPTDYVVDEREDERTYAEKYETLNRVFRIFDLNRDMFLNCEELALMLQCFFPDRISKQELISLMKGIDADRNGQLDFKEFIEFLTLMTRMQKGLQKALKAKQKNGMLMEMFHRYDFDCSDSLDPDEVHKLLIHANPEVYVDRFYNVLLINLDLEIREDMDPVRFNQWVEIFIRQPTLEERIDAHMKRLEECFRVIDKENRGYLGKNEMRWFVQKLDVKPDAAKAVIQAMDIDGDGNVDFAEFAITMMTSNIRPDKILAKVGGGVQLEMTRDAIRASLPEGWEPVISRSKQKIYFRSLLDPKHKCWTRPTAPAIAEFRRGRREAIYELTAKLVEDEKDRGASAQTQVVRTRINSAQSVRMKSAQSVPGLFAR